MQQYVLLNLRICYFKCNLTSFQPAQDTNAMNKNLTNLWNLSKPASQPAVAESSNAPEDSQENGNVENESAAASEPEVKAKKRTKSSLSGSHKRARSK
jgi:hypothetical protein